MSSCVLWDNTSSFDCLPYSLSTHLHRKSHQSVCHGNVSLGMRKARQHFFFPKARPSVIWSFSIYTNNFYRNTITSFLPGDYFLGQNFAFVLFIVLVFELLLLLLLFHVHSKMLFYLLSITGVMPWRFLLQHIFYCFYFVEIVLYSPNSQRFAV